MHDEGGREQTVYLFYDNFIVTEVEESK